jgi:hypothetical protein
MLQISAQLIEFVLADPLHLLFLLELSGELV